MSDPREAESALVEEELDRRDEIREQRRAQRRERRIPTPSKWLYELTIVDILGAEGAP